jgi:hypothetical protein
MIAKTGMDLVIDGLPGLMDAASRRDNQGKQNDRHHSIGRNI